MWEEYDLKVEYNVDPTASNKMNNEVVQRLKCKIGDSNIRKGRACFASKLRNTISINYMSN